MLLNDEEIMVFLDESDIEFEDDDNADPTFLLLN